MTETHAGNLKLLGGRLCLDFTNTVDRHTSEPSVEFLHTYADLVRWSHYVGIVNEDEASHLATLVQRAPDQAQRVFERAIRLREAMFRMFQVVAAGDAPPAADMAILNETLAEAPSRSRIVWTAPHFTWTFDGDGEALDRMLWPVAWSAGDLLTSDELARVKLCPSEGCGWLFVDASRNSSRRWCAMESCGNRAKARRHYRKSKEAAT